MFNKKNAFLIILTGLAYLQYSQIELPENYPQPILYKFNYYLTRGLCLIVRTYTHSKNIKK